MQPQENLNLLGEDGKCGISEKEQVKQRRKINNS